jgi:hypothetical protein
MDKESHKKEKHNYPKDLDFFLKRDIPDHQVVAILKTQNKSEEEIERILEKLQESRDKLNKTVNKVLHKLSGKIFALDIPERVKRGMKYAKKYELNDTELMVLRKQLMESTPSALQYSYMDELRYTEMSKFLGFDSSSLMMRHPCYPLPQFGLKNVQVLKLQPKDHAKIHDISIVYEGNKFLFNDVKRQALMYQDCAAQAIMGKYDKDKHNSSSYIHPVVAALFLPKVEYLEKRMLLSNIGRMILMRAQPYLTEKSTFNDNNMLPNEIENEMDFAYDIAADPNSLDYFAGAENTPVDNLIKRYKIQIELWKNVLFLRQGKYFASGNSYGEEDKTGIVGLMKILNGYEWTYFDSPDMYSYQDDGNVLRKLLSVFSIRPTYVQYSTVGSPMPVMYPGALPYGEFARPTFTYIPMITLRLSQAAYGQSAQALSIAGSLNLDDIVLEHKVPVFKRRTVYCTHSVIFFYVHRKQTNVNLANIGGSFIKFANVPGSMYGKSALNETMIDVSPALPIGNDTFALKSFVVAQTMPLTSTGDSILIGSAAFVIRESNGPAVFYNPQGSSMVDTDGNNATPTSHVFPYQTSGNVREIGYMNEASTKGTIFLYVKQE